MKTLTTIILIIFTNMMNAQLNESTKDKIKLYYSNALVASRSENNFSLALEKLKDIEKLTGKPIPYTDVLDLKISVLINLNKIDEAKEDLNYWLNMNLNDTQIKDAKYYKKIINLKEKSKNIVKRSAEILKYSEQESIKLNYEIEKKNTGYKFVNAMRIDIDKAPIFLGCEEVYDTKKCFGEKIFKYFKENYNSNNNIGLELNKQRIFVGFSIGINGNVFNVKVKGPSIKIEKEVTKIIQSLPIIEGAFFDNEKVVMNYSIPLAININ